MRILNGDDEIARHERSYDAGRQLEDPRHLAALADDKRSARDHRGRNRLFAACPASRDFLGGVADHGGHLGGTTTRLLHLLDQHGASALDHAIHEAHGRGAFRAESVAHLLDQRRRAAGKKPFVEPALPDDPRVRGLVVEPHKLEDYDQLARGTDDPDGGVR